MPSTRKSRGSSRSKSSTPRRARERLQWNDLNDSVTEEKGSSADDEQKAPPTRRKRWTREIAEPEKKDEQTDILKKQVVDPQKQLAELQKRDRTATLIRRVAELEAHLTEAKSSTATEPAFNTALPRAITGATGP